MQTKLDPRTLPPAGVPAALDTPQAADPKRGLVGLPFAEQEAALAPVEPVQRTPAATAAPPIAYTAQGTVQDPSRFTYTEASAGQGGMLTRGSGEVRLPVASIVGGPVPFAGNVVSATLVGLPAGAQGTATIEGRGAAAVVVLRMSGLTAPSALGVPVAELVTDAGQTVRVPLAVRGVDCDTTVVERFQKQQALSSEQGQLAGYETQAANLAGAPAAAERSSRAGSAEAVAYARAILADLAARGERTAELEAHLDALFARADDATRANIIAGAAGYASAAGSIPADAAARIQSAGYRVVALTAKASTLRAEIQSSAGAVGLYPAGSDAGKQLQASLTAKQAELAALEAEMKALVAEVTRAVDTFALKDERERATANALEPDSERRLLDLRDDQKAAGQKQFAEGQLARADASAASARASAAAQAGPEAAALQAKIASTRADLARLQQELAAITSTTRHLSLTPSGG